MPKFHVEKPHKQRNFTVLILLLILPFLLLTVAGVGTAYWYQENIKPLSNDQTEIIVNIEEGATLQEISELLELQGVIKSARAFDWYSRLNNYRDSFQAGGYKFSPSDSVSEIAKKLSSGDIASDLVIILPAQRIDQIKSAMMRAEFSRDEVNQAFNVNNYKQHPVVFYIPENANLEGYLYPNSYQRNTTTKLTEILTQSLDEMYEALTPELRATFAERGLTVHQAVTLASIVESEVPAESNDRKTVAQVYLKRLAEGIPLQADPTAQYGTLFATGTDEGWRYYDTPYNTYLYPGLPPGPISNVSKSSLEAVANPANSDFLFFVSGDDDKTYFSRTLAEHEENIAKHCKIKCSSY